MVIRFVHSRGKKCPIALRVCNTDSTNFPIANAAQWTDRGSAAAFVAKLDRRAQRSFTPPTFGGSGIEGSTAIAVEVQAMRILTGLRPGVTDPNSFPAARVFQRAYGGGAADGFVAKIRPGPAINGAAVTGKK